MTGNLVARSVQYETGKPGRRMIYDAFQSDSVYSSYATDNMPKPIGSGEFKDNPGSWFYMCDFHDMLKNLPDVSDLIDIVVKVYRASMGHSQTGKFGLNTPMRLEPVETEGRSTKSCLIHSDL
ncbi:hypothetical protein G6011_11520 [Alternaria panax]|uniref:Uncharacterized protein n=1 Tax=Alternaria panax TaxID=48097 RepID=A0AAD4NQ20_9PLEO|nr:hypothetical protein G6011_11520 [Alternaria panax]